MDIDGAGHGYGGCAECNSPEWLARLAPEVQ